jgi:hypothetical protein
MSVNGLIVVSYLCGVAALIDTYRRPYHDWEHADRDRFHWGMVGIFMTVFVLGVVYALLYIVLVVPRFGSGSRTGGDFKKNDFAR